MAAGVIASAGGIALLIPPSITLILFGVITEMSIVDLFFAGIIPGLMLAMSDAVIIVSVSLFIKLPRGKFDLCEVWRCFKEALPALLMPISLATLVFSLLTMSAAFFISRFITLLEPMPVIDKPIKATF